MQHPVTVKALVRLAVPAALLAVALGFAIANGRIGDAVITGVLLAPPVAFFTFAAYVRATRRGGH